VLAGDDLSAVAIALASLIDAETGYTATA